MKKLSNYIYCPICNQKSTFLGYGVIAPWIIELTESQNLRTKLCQCSNCMMYFFTYRYSPKELKCIYSEYRSDEYFQRRKSWEFWYTRKENDHYLNYNFITIRKNLLKNILVKLGVETSGKYSYVDYGGDHGQFIPETKLKKYVIEYNSLAKASTIKFVKNFSGVKEPIRVISNQHVLEHVNNPVKTLKLFKKNLHPKASKQASTSKGIIITEVPLDIYRVSKLARTRLYKNYLDFLLKHKNFFIVFDFFSGVYRQFFHYLPFFGIIKQSEHINYFNKKSAERIFEISGLKILSINSGSYQLGKIKFKTLIICSEK